MNKKQQELFVAFFDEIIEAEEIFQEIKRKMRDCKHFNASALFDLISGGLDRIEITRLRQYLTDKISCNERELYQLFQKLDMSRLGYITRNDFIRQITPFDEQVQKRPNGSGTVSSQIQGYFLSLIIQYIKRLRILDIARKQVYFIKPYDAFAEIDNFKTGIIGLGQLQRFMNKNDFKINQYQLMLLLHGLRRRCYLEVNLQVFCQNLEPLQFGQYQEYRAHIQAQQQKQFLNRSRKQQQVMKRSRIQSWKIQHNIAKQQRRRKAEIQRQLELENRINQQLLQQQNQKQRYIRRAMLQQDKNIRWNVQAGNRMLQAQKQKQLAEKYHNQELKVLRNRQDQAKNVLINTAFRRQDQLQNSRRARYNLQLQRQRQYNIQLQRQRQQEIQYRRQIQLQRQKQIQRQRQIQRIQFLRQKAAREQFQLQRHYSRHYVPPIAPIAPIIPEIDVNRRLYEQQLRLQRERSQRQYQIQRIRKLQSSTNYKPAYQPQSQSRRIAELERDVQKTRSQIRQRQSRYNYMAESKRQPQTADKDYLDPRDYRGGYRG